MSEADQASAAKSLKAIDFHLKELAKVMTAINENLVTVGKTVNAWFQTVEEVSVQTVPPNVARSQAGLKQEPNKGEPNARPAE